ncbi:MAG: hypothetical protein MPJ08_08110 [Nitrosopumilus sp.]|nr:hypothetical protein [Nitrosopumilus sp.]
MKVACSVEFDSKFESEWHTRRAIVLPLIDRIEEAESLADLGDILTCEAGADYCVYNRICKLYFAYDTKNNAAELMGYAFRTFSEDV